MAIVTYRGHVLMVDGWEKACVEGNEPLLRKMATLEEFSEDEETYMVQRHEEYDARRGAADKAFADTLGFIFKAGLLAVFVAAVVYTVRYVRQVKKS